MTDTRWQDGYLRLHPRAAIKWLEQLCLYHIARDDLYELSESAEPFLMRCDGTSRGSDLTSDSEFVEYCLKEGLIEVMTKPVPALVSICRAPKPSLRYLELQLLHACNLKCRHCYLGPARPDTLPLQDALSITEEFAAHGGLRLLISGGEPLLYPHLKSFIANTASLPIRRVLLTNGILVSEENVNWLQVEEIQFSLDGWRRGHDLLRGKGNFDRTLRAIRVVKDAGIPVSIATMVHKGNLDEFQELRSFTQEIEAIEWGVDVPCMAGAMHQNRDLIVAYDKAVKFMEFAYGGGYHGSSDGYACGRHLMTVLPTGKAVKCGFYEDSPLGDAREGLISCWLRLKHIALEELQCKVCPVVEECAGGCRFRAPHPLAPDPVMCAAYGMGSATKDPV